MFRPSHFEVSLRQQEQLRNAEYRRWAAAARRTERSGRIARALGLPAQITRVAFAR